MPVIHPPSLAVEKSFIVQPSRTLRRVIARFAFALTLILCLLAAYAARRGGFNNALDTVLLPIGAPVAAVIAAPLDLFAGVRDSIADWSVRKESYAALKRENAALKQELRASEYRNRANARLKKLLEYQENYPYRFISGRIVSARDNGISDRALVLLDAEAAGADKYPYAVMNEAGLAGRVISYSNGAARVMLLNDVSSRVPVITSQSFERAVVAGTGGRYPRLEMTDDEHNIRPGELVLTSGDGGLLPPDIFVGTVIDGGNGDLYILPFAPAYRLRDVSVAVPERFYGERETPAREPASLWGTPAAGAEE